MFVIKTNKMGKEILRLKWAEPFRPFVITTDDGKSRRVTYDMQVTVTPRGNNVAMYQGSEGFVHFPVASVISVKPVPGRQRSTGKRLRRN